MKVTLAQLNPIVGDIEGNAARIQQILSRYSKDSPDLVVFTELFLVGYPPRDLLERPAFIEKTERAIEDLLHLSREYPRTGILFGAPVANQHFTGKGLYNSALLLFGGEIRFTHHKSLLPTYDVFDESRHFDAGGENAVVSFKGETLGISICEDAWNDPALWLRRTYAYDPIEVMASKGASMFINLAASPFHQSKEMIRYNIARSHATRHKIPFVFVNQVGGNDELIFDGRSLCVGGTGDLLAALPHFSEHVETVDLKGKGVEKPYVPQDEMESVYQALVVGVRDYIRKCGFKSAVVGLSGGIDSAVTCALAAAAIGAENVTAVSMPGPYSSRGSVEDSRKLAGNLGISFEVVPITPVYNAYLDSLEPHFRGRQPDTTEENIQARIRGNILMALSNKFGHLVLSTGNKSELAVGYCTLYGDMSGGLSVISDVPKTMVYRLARFINSDSEIIPPEIIDKPPTAELKENQLDQDTLPAYEVLDQILHLYLDEGHSLQQIVDSGFHRETVRWVIQAVDRNEYKRRQAVPGLKVTSKAFGMGRRMPIAARFPL